MLISYNSAINQPSNDFFIRIISSGDALCGTDWHAKEPMPPYSRMYYILDGGGRLEWAEGELTMKKGRLYLIPAGYSFSYSCADSMRQLYFHIDLVNRGGYDLLRGVEQILELEVSVDRMEQMAELYRSTDAVDMLEIRSILMSDLTVMLKGSGIRFDQRGYCDCVRRAIKVIGDSPRVSLRVGEIAERCYVSADTLAHKFKQEVGVSVGRYIDELVMFRAQELLIKSDMSIAQISATLEFCDQFYFSRRFKERHGISPQAYRSQRKTDG